MTKMSLGKISLREGWSQIIQEEMERSMISWLQIQQIHCVAVIDLPFHHRDPFDRMLIAQAMVEDMHLLTRDRRLSAYEVERIW